MRHFAVTHTIECPPERKEPHCAQRAAAPFPWLRDTAELISERYLISASSAATVRIMLQLPQRARKRMGHMYYTLGHSPAAAGLFN